MGHGFNLIKTHLFGGEECGVQVIHLQSENKATKTRLASLWSWILNQDMQQQFYQEEKEPTFYARQCVSHLSSKFSFVKIPV